MLACAQLLQLGQLALEQGVLLLKLGLELLGLLDELRLGVAHFAQVVDVAEELLKVRGVEEHVERRGGAVLVTVGDVRGKLFFEL